MYLEIHYKFIFYISRFLNPWMTLIHSLISFYVYHQIKMIELLEQRNNGLQLVVSRILKEYINGRICCKIPCNQNELLKDNQLPVFEPFTKMICT